MKMSISGIPEITTLLSTVGPREAKNIMRATVHGIASEVRDDAKRNYPDGYYATGKAVKATKSKRRRGSFGLIRSDVVVEKQAFYWRFLEYGQGPDNTEWAMFGKAVESLRREFPTILRNQFGKKWEAAMRRAAKRNGN